MKFPKISRMLFAQMIDAYNGSYNFKAPSEETHKAKSKIKTAKAHPDPYVGASILYVNARANMSKGTEVERLYAVNAVECIEKLPNAVGKILVSIRSSDADCVLKNESYKSLFKIMKNIKDEEELLKTALQAAIFADPNSSWETLAGNKCRDILNNISDTDVRKETLNSALAYVKNIRKKAGFKQADDKRGLKIQKDLAQTIFDMDRNNFTPTPMHPKFPPKGSQSAATAHTKR